MKNYHCPVKELCESIDSHAITTLSKKPIFIVSCNLCYFNCMFALQPCFTFAILCHPLSIGSVGE